MKIDRNFPKVNITKKQEFSIKQGHPWVFSDEIIKTSGSLNNGALVDVLCGNSYQGTGFYNSNSKIAVRIISNNANEIFKNDFWIRRFDYAIKYRKTVMGDTDFNCCRLVHGEADGLPGFTVDRYNNILCTQIACFGIEQIKIDIYNSLLQALENNDVHIDGIYERNEFSLRQKEGLLLYKGWFVNADKKFNLSSNLDTKIIIEENKIKYYVDIEGGQKTGFFLDQKYNRKAVSSISKDKIVLDCFTHTGSFGINALFGGAKKVTSVDISQSAIDMAMQNAKLNNVLDKIEFKCQDVFEMLTNIANEKNSKYDFIILDPPAFTKSRGTISNATKGYKEINYKAMKILPRGGYLVTCTCSHFMDIEKFVYMLKSAAHDANVRLLEVESRKQSPDHPILWNVPETEYLHFFIFQVV